MQILRLRRQCFCTRFTCGVRGTARLGQQPHTFSVCFSGGLAQQGRSLFVKRLVLFLELVLLLVGLGLGVGSVLELGGNLRFSRCDSVEHRLVKKTLHQPDQDEKVQHLGCDGEPVDEHGLFTCRLGNRRDSGIPEWVGEDQDHRHDKAVNGH